MSKFIFCFALLALLNACSGNDTAENVRSFNRDTTTTSPAAPEDEARPLPALPSFVAFKNWVIGDPARTLSVLSVYRTWDHGNTDSMALYFADSATYDFPNGSRQITSRHTIEATFRRWRHEYKETSNTPFSLISLHNKDLDQEWVIAWTWNKWQYADGKKDSALYCDNWRIQNGKIIYLNSLENHPSKQLARRLNENIPR